MAAYSADMDSTDRTLLAALRRDARLPLSDLAALAGVSRATVRARIAKLVETGVIRGFSVLTAEDVDSAPVRGLMMLEIEGAGAERVRRQLLGWPAVAHVHSTNGRWDLIVEIGTDTLEAFDRILFDIRRVPGVTASETSLLLSTQRGKRV